MKALLLILLLPISFAFAIPESLTETNPGVINKELQLLYPHNAKTFYGISSNFNSNCGDNCNGLSVIAVNDGSPSAIVPIWNLGFVNASNSGAFGGNDIVTSNHNTKNISMVGREIDVQPDPSSTLSTSAGLYLNAFNLPLNGPAIQTGGINNGSFADGFMCNGISGTCVGVVGGSKNLNSLINTANGHYNTGAVIIGNTFNNPGQVIRFLPNGNWDDFSSLYIDSSNNFHVTSKGAVQIDSSSLIETDTNGNHCTQINYPNDTVKCRH